MQRIFQELRQRPRNPMVMDLESPQWDTFVSVYEDGVGSCDMGLGIFCGLLALVLCHRIEPTTFFGGVRYHPHSHTYVELSMMRLLLLYSAM
jgi:hypothetical protein